MGTVRVGFTSAYCDPVMSAYPLGHGYRWYLPSLMRFAAPDSRSPFGPGGINSYAYCGADPINRIDPSGHAWEMAWAADLAEESMQESEAISAWKAERPAWKALREERGETGILKKSWTEPWDKRLRQPRSTTFIRRVRKQPDRAPTPRTGPPLLPPELREARPKPLTWQEALDMTHDDHLARASAYLMHAEIQIPILEGQALRAESKFAGEDLAPTKLKRWNSQLKKARDDQDAAADDLSAAARLLHALPDGGAASLWEQYAGLSKRVVAAGTRLLPFRYVNPQEIEFQKIELTFDD